MSSLFALAVTAAITLGGSFDSFDATPPGEARPGFTTLGSVRLNPTSGEIEVDGYFNLRRGFIEFLACLPEVKSHESLISLDCDPVDLNAAILLLGVEPGKPPRSEMDLAPIEGPRLMIRLRYAMSDRPYHVDPESEETFTTWVRDVRAEDVIINGPMEREMARCGFVFTGSQFIEDLEVEVAEGEKPPEVYAPRVLGQLISLAHRPMAILDNPLALPFRDGDYYAYGDVLPRLKRDEAVPVTMVIRRPRPGEIDRSITRMELPPPPKQDPISEGDSR